MQSKLQHPIELKCADRVLVIRRSKVWPGIVEICDQGIAVLKTTLSPDAPLVTVLATVGKFLADEALPGAEAARVNGPEWECLWEPWEGRVTTDGIVELDIRAVLRDIVTDHNIYRGIDTCIWTATGDDVGGIDYWSDPEGYWSDPDRLLDAVREAISDLLISGKTYFLKLTVDAPESTTRMYKLFSV